MKCGEALWLLEWRLIFPRSTVLKITTGQYRDAIRTVRRTLSTSPEHQRMADRVEEKLRYKAVKSDRWDSAKSGRP